MPTPTTPSEVFREQLRRIEAGDWASLGELYADHTEVEQPFAIPAPVRLRGREELNRHFHAATGMPMRLEVHNLLVHETTDPEVIVAEFDYKCHFPASGETVKVANIGVLRVRDGKIVASRDYHDHRVMGEAISRAASAATGVSAEPTQGTDPS